MDRQRLARAACAGTVRARGDFGLRGARDLVAAGVGPWRDRLGSAGGPAGSLCRGDGFHPCRAPADHGASVRRLVGLPAARPVRAAGAARASGRVRPLRRSLPRRGHRRAARLGAGAFPDRCAWPRAFRRLGTLRARRSAGRIPSGLEYQHLQSGPQRSARLHDRQRALLARAVARGRAARGCGGVDALPRLLAQRRRVDPQPVWRPGKSRIDRLPAGSQPRGEGAGAGCDIGGRGKHLFSARLAVGRRRRARVRLQVEHGVDARHAPLHGRAADLPAVSPRRDFIRPGLCFLRTLHAAAEPRRGRLRQGLDDRQNAR